MRAILVFLFLISCFSSINAQLVSLNGTPLVDAGGGVANCIAGGYKTQNQAVVSGNCLSMTQAAFQSGAIWVCDPINLNESFKLNFKANFDSPNSGDGIAFILQREGVPAVIGGAGGGMGYSVGNGVGCQGGNCIVDSSIVVEFDIWDNSAGAWDGSNPGLGNINDIPCDHVSIQTDGIQLASNALVPPACLLPANGMVTDGANHDVCIIWDLAALEYKVYFDSVEVTVYNGDIRTQFSDPSAVFWGFTAGSGGANQNLTICEIRMETNIPSPLCYCTASTLNQTATVTSNYNGSEISCFNGQNGTANAVANGGLPAYNYLWSNGQTTANATGLDANIFYVTVTDGQGCNHIDSVVVNQPDSISPNTVASSNYNGASISCFGESDGEVSSSGVGGTGAYSFVWSNGSSSAIATGLSVGTYYVTLTDVNNCSQVDSITLVEPTIISNTNSVTNVACNAGSTGAIDLSPNGGTGAYSFVWSNGATSEDINALVAGTYYVTLTDANNCSQIDSVTLGEPTSISNTNSITNVICNGASTGAIDLSPNGGTGAYSFVWSNGATSEDINALAAGSYSVTIMDANGCSMMSTGISVSEPVALSSTNSTTPVSCIGNNGAINLTVSGGNAPYNFLWSNGTTTEDLNSIASGNYIVTVTDNNGCLYLDSIDVAFTSNITVVIDSIQEESCDLNNNAAIFISVSGGSLPYNYSWSTGATTQNLVGISGGNYALTITDNNACTATVSATVQSPFVPTLAASISSNSISLGDSPVMLDVGNDQSSQSVTYAWSAVGPGNANINSPSSPSTSTDPDAAGAYSYTIIASSANGCTDSITLFLSVLELSDPKIPNAFTPNGDGANDIFSVIDLNPQYLIDFKIINRWGNMVYDDASNGAWDGTMNGVEQAKDVYIYLISWQLPGEEKVFKKGEVTLLR